MKLCAAVRRRGSDSQCSSPALLGCTLCLSHIRNRQVELWADVHRSRTNMVARFQAIVRGWLVRRRLALAGPGVLCRHNVANPEDLETCDEASRVHPLDYFAFAESGKVWWFSFPTIWRWACRSAHPVNPYTKTPLSADTCTRLRAVWRYKRSLEGGVPEEHLTTTYIDRIRFRVHIVCQLFRDHGFGTISPSTFLELTRSQWIALFRMIRDDLPTTLPNSQADTREMCRRYLEYMTETSASLSKEQYLNQASRVLFLMLLYPKDPYIVAFTVLSAMYRV